MKEGTLTLENMEKIFAESKKLGQEDFALYVTPEVRKSIDNYWRKLSWIIKLQINIYRLFHGMGIYRV